GSEIHVVHRRQASVVWLGHDGAHPLSHRFRNSQLFRWGTNLDLGDMTPQIGRRAEKALLLSGPEGNPNRSRRPYAKGIEDTHRLQGDDHACSIVGGACANCPAIEVSGDHDDFISATFVDAWSVG